MRNSILALLIFLSSCATALPPRPTSCDYEVDRFQIYELPIDYLDATFYCLGPDDVDTLASNYHKMVQCNTDLTIWMIQVEQGRE